MEKALLIIFLENIQKNIFIGKHNIKPKLKPECFKKIDCIECFDELNKAENDIDGLLELLKND